MDEDMNTRARRSLPLVLFTGECNERLAQLDTELLECDERPTRVGARR
jgi:hypothetical protein